MKYLSGLKPTMALIIFYRKVYHTEMMYSLMRRFRLAPINVKVTYRRHIWYKYNMCFLCPLFMTWNAEMVFRYCYEVQSTGFDQPGSMITLIGRIIYQREKSLCLLCISWTAWRKLKLFDIKNYRYVVQSISFHCPGAKSVYHTETMYRA